MAAEAEASREARAKVIAADGEKRASKALRDASNVIDESPSALQLRYLQVSCQKLPKRFKNNVDLTLGTKFGFLSPVTINLFQYPNRFPF
jgi:hypothetical protein